jgi:hypothetical protein
LQHEHRTTAGGDTFAAAQAARDGKDVADDGGCRAPVATRIAGDEATDDDGRDTLQGVERVDDDTLLPSQCPCNVLCTGVARTL